MQEFDAVLVLSFGGPERREDVIPFLENVLRGRNVPRERLLEVAEHYYHFGGKSPINDQNRALVASLREELAQHGPSLPVYWGNRNWDPYLKDTLIQMRDEGVVRALVFVTSAFSSYSGCRQYLEDMEKARAAVDTAPELVKLPAFFDHSGFIESMADHIHEVARPGSRLIFTAHSVPLSMSASSPYVAQITEACKLVAAAAGFDHWVLAYQSRSGPPSQPWLEPDIADALRAVKADGVTDVVIAPIGFITDHMEVLYDLDTEAAATCDELGIRMTRAKTAGSNLRFIAMIRDLIGRSLQFPPSPCPAECCAPPQRGR